MNKKEKIRLSLSAVCCAAVLLLTTASVLAFWTVGGDGNMQVRGASCFRYFTIDSNILAAAACAALGFCCVRSLMLGRLAVPRAVSVLKFVGTVAVAVTFLTVMFFLGPALGYGAMLYGNNLFLHLVCPVLCILSLVFFEPGCGMKWRESLWGMIPTAVYGALYFVMVVVLGENGGWEDFYGFNRGGMWPVSVVAMLAATLAICSALYGCKREK